MIATQTTITLSDASAVFPARFGGTCALSGRAFLSGERGRMASVNGAKAGFVTQAALDWFESRCTESGNVYTINFSREVERAAEFVAAGLTLTLLNKQGARTVCFKTAAGWEVKNAGNPFGRLVSEKQVVAMAAKAFAIKAATKGA